MSETVEQWTSHSIAQVFRAANVAVFLRTGSKTWIISSYLAVKDWLTINTGINQLRADKDVDLSVAVLTSWLPSTFTDNCKYPPLVYFLGGGRKQWYFWSDYIPRKYSSCVQGQGRATTACNFHNVLVLDVDNRLWSNTDWFLRRISPFSAHNCPVVLSTRFISTCNLNIWQLKLHLSVSPEGFQVSNVNLWQQIFSPLDDAATYVVDRLHAWKIYTPYMDWMFFFLKANWFQHSDYYFLVLIAVGCEEESPCSPGANMQQHRERHHTFQVDYPSSGKVVQRFQQGQ